jgi:glycine/sarcosine N-methyltransferase
MFHAVDCTDLPDVDILGGWSYVHEDQSRCIPQSARFVRGGKPMDAVQGDKSGIAGFYDWLAPEYDRMTGFDERFERETPVFRQIVDRYGTRSAVDAGCGTGFLSLLLARIGVDVTAADLSALMLKALEERAAAAGLAISILAGPFQDIGRQVSPPVDAVFCLGNSLPHLLTEDDLSASLRSFATALRPGGLLVLQTLNYDRILAAKERVQSVKETGGTTYVRFYDYEESLLRFNILRLTKQAGGIVHEMRSITLRPILKNPLCRLLSEAGFVDAAPFGGFAKEEFLPETSRDLVVFCSKDASSGR